MATADDDFCSWLGRKLKELNTDEGVFGSYIIGILDGDETQEEKVEALEGILSDMFVNDISSVCKEIMDMWVKLKQPKPSLETTFKEDVDVKLARLLEYQSLQTPKQKQYTDEEKKIREAILSQYSQMTDDENEEEREENDKNTSLSKNCNAIMVQLAEKEKREQAKLESQKKKEKDKEDREKQKQMKEEKKEKRKTQKGERRR